LEKSEERNKETQSTRQAIETHMGEELMHKSSFKTQELLRWKGDNKENSKSRNERIAEFTI
jgi:hypothetical protein